MEVVPIATLGRAFVEVRADTDKFPDDVRKAMRRLDQDTKQDTDRAGQRMGDRIATQLRARLTQQLGRQGLNVNITPNLNVTRLAAVNAALNRATRNRTVNIRVNERGGRRGGILGGIGGFFGTFAVSATRILGDFFNFGRQIGQIFGEVFKTFQKAGGSAAALAAGFAQLVAAIAALAAVMTLLIGIIGVLLAGLSALYQSALLILAVLPGLGLVFLAAVGPLVLVFTNLGEAIKATAGDLDEFNTAIEDLGPGTQGALRGLRSLVQFFQGIREQVQEAFFAPISQAVSEMRDDLGPVFERGFIRVADAAGQFVGDLLGLFEHPNTERFFDNIFRLADLGFEQIGGAVNDLVAAFANLVNKLFPETEGAIEGIADTIEGWADGINDFANDPDLQETLDEWKESFQTIRDLIGTTVELAQTLFNGFQDDGIPILERINGMMQDFIGYLESPEGQEFFDGLRISATALLFVIAAIGVLFSDWLELLGGIGELFEGDLTDAVDTFSNTWLGIVLFGWLIAVKNIADEIADIFIGWKDDIQAILDPTKSLKERFDEIVSLVRRIADWLNRGWQRVLQLKTAAQAAVQQFQPLLNVARSIRDAFSAALGFVERAAATAANVASFSLFGINFGNIFGAEGGIFTRPTSKIIGEAGPEVLIPLTKPQRAMELIQASGLMNLVRGGDGASTPSISIMLSPEINAFIGNQPLKDMVRVEVSNTNRDIKTRQLARMGSNRR